MHIQVVGLRVELLGEGLPHEEGHTGAVDPRVVGRRCHASQVVLALLCELRSAQYVFYNGKYTVGAVVVIEVDNIAMQTQDFCQQESVWAKLQPCTCSSILYSGKRIMYLGVDSGAGELPVVGDQAVSCHRSLHRSQRVSGYLMAQAPGPTVDHDAHLACSVTCAGGQNTVNAIE